MKSSAVLCACLLLVPAAADPGELAPAQRVHGLSLIWQEANYNFAFFDQVPQLDWDGAYQAFLPEVLAAESTLEYYRLLQRFIALLQDAHTNVRFPQDLIQARVWSDPWVLVERVDGQAYVRSVGADLQRQLPVGSLITHIDGTPTERYVRSQVAPYIAASTEHGLLDHAYREALHGQAGSAVQIGFVTPDGRRDDLSLLRDRWTRADEWVPDPNVRRPRFAVTWPQETIALVAPNTFEDAGVVDDWLSALPELRQAEALIIDIRNNPGGNSGVGWAIASWLTDVPLQTSAWRTREHRAALQREHGAAAVPGASRRRHGDHLHQAGHLSGRPGLRRGGHHAGRPGAALRVRCPLRARRHARTGAATSSDPARSMIEPVRAVRRAGAAPGRVLRRAGRGSLHPDEGPARCLN